MILENGKLRDVGHGVKGETLGYVRPNDFMPDERIAGTHAQMAKGVLGAIKALAKSGVKICSAEEREARLEICKVCEWHAPKFNRCRKCGCFLDVKVSMNVWHCPVGKW
jgi:hypothetical protein